MTAADRTATVTITVRVDLRRRSLARRARPEAVHAVLEAVAELPAGAEVELLVDDWPDQRAVDELRCSPAGMFRVKGSDAQAVRRWRHALFSDWSPPHGVQGRSVQAVARTPIPPGPRTLTR